MVIFKVWLLLLLFFYVHRVSMAQMEFLAEMEDQVQMAMRDRKVKMLWFERSSLEETQDWMVTRKLRNGCKSQYNIIFPKVLSILFSNNSFISLVATILNMCCTTECLVFPYWHKGEGEDLQKYKFSDKAKTLFCCKDKRLFCGKFRLISGRMYSETLDFHHFEKKFLLQQKKWKKGSFSHKTLLLSVFGLNDAVKDW